MRDRKAKISSGCKNIKKKKEEGEKSLCAGENENFIRNLIEAFHCS